MEVPEGRRYIYNTISTQWIDVFPNPEGVWEDDIDCYDPSTKDRMDDNHYD
jgi:hypothetical protein